MSRHTRDRAPRCPSWCELPNGHPFATLDHDSDAWRVHVATLAAPAGALLTLEQDERPGDDHPPRDDRTAPYVCLVLEHAAAECSAEDARALAQALDHAAERLDRLTGASSTRLAAVRTLRPSD